MFFFNCLFELFQFFQGHAKFKNVKSWDNLYLTHAVRNITMFVPILNFRCYVLTALILQKKKKLLIVCTFPVALVKRKNSGRIVNSQKTVSKNKKYIDFYTFILLQNNTLSWEVINFQSYWNCLIMLSFVCILIFFSN